MLALMIVLLALATAGGASAQDVSPAMRTQQAPRPMMDHAEPPSRDVQTTGSIGGDVSRPFVPGMVRGLRGSLGGPDGPGFGFVPPPGESRFVPDEVLVEARSDLPDRILARIAKRHRLVRLGTTDATLNGTTLHRWRIPDGRGVRAVIRSLARERGLLSVQANHLFRAQ